MPDNDLERQLEAPSRRFRPYPEYKSSVVDWLGDIPSHWEAKKIKRLCLVRRGASPRPIEDPIYFDDDGDYAWVRIADVTASEHYLLTTSQRLSELGMSKSVPLEPGSLFVSIAATVGKPIVAKIKCCIHDGFVYFVGLRESADFLYYVFSSGEAYRGLGKLGTQLNLNTDSIGEIRVPIPPIAEQDSVVEFLDRETAKLDALVERKERLIELLHEKRTTLITRAVTKGLNPSAPMKNSGEEWLGDVPVHWQKRRMADLAKMISGGTPNKDKLEYWRGEIPWVSPKDMKSRAISNTIDHVSEAAVRETCLALVEPRSVLIVVRGMILAHTFPVAYTTVPVTVNQDMKALRLVDGIDSNYFVYLLEGMSGIILSLIEEAGHGTKRLRTDLWRAVEIYLPTLDEQLEIAAFLDREIVRLGGLIERLESAIARLRELRTALISAAVTGKIDVRGEVA